MYIIKKIVYTICLLYTLNLILSSIETVINDVLELNCMLDKYNTEFLDIAAKLNVSEYDGELIKNYQITQEKLKVINKLSELAEKCLDKLCVVSRFVNESKEEKL